MRLFAALALAFFSVEKGRCQLPVFRPVDFERRVSVISQCSDGWLWLGTEKGVFQFDGLSFQPVALPSDSIFRSPVTAIFEEKKAAQIWLGFENGAVARVGPDGQTRLFQPEEGLPKAAITGFAEDEKGQIWLSTYGEGLYVFDGRRLFNFDAASDGLAGDDIYGLAKTADGAIWAATDAGASICSFSSERGAAKKQVKNVSKKDGLSDEIVRSILAEPSGKGVWMGFYDHGFGRFDAEKGHFEPFFEKWELGPIVALAVFEGRELWLGTEENGLAIFDLQTKKLRRPPVGSPFRQAKTSALFADSEGQIWASTSDGQLAVGHTGFQNLPFLAAQTPPKNVQAVLVDASDRLFFGAADGLFWAETADDGQPFFRKILSENVVSLAAGPDGSIWAGTFGRGLFRVCAEKGLLQKISEKDGLLNGSVLSVAAHGRSVWLATLGGVSELIFDEKGQFRVKNWASDGEIGANYVYKIFLDSRGRVWFGTDGAGLAALENGVFRHFREAQNQPLKTIYSICEGRDGRIFFTSAGGGLFVFDEKNGIEKVEIGPKLDAAELLSLSTDGLGRIILGWSGGLAAFSPTKNHTAFFEKSVGLAALRPNLNASCVDRFGNVWTGGEGGIFKVAPPAEEPPIDPKISLRSVSVFSQLLDYQRVTSFAHDQNFFQFEFAGIWLTAPETVRFRYKMDGFDLAWTETSDRRASFPKLPPGRYVFKIQASEHGDFSSAAEKKWAFEIKKPFWAEAWFIVLSLAAAIGGLFFFIKKRDEARARTADLRRQLVENQLVTLKSQINPHFLFNSFNSLAATIEDDPKKAIEHVERLSDFFRSVLAYREKDRISVGEEVELLKNYAFLLEKRYEENFRLDIKMGAAAGGFLMPMTLQMLVENAVKHNVIARGRPLAVEIWTENEGRTVAVRNNFQPKIRPEASTHFGLESLRSRYELLGAGRVEVENEGGFFTVKLPILEEK